MEPQLGQFLLYQHLAAVAYHVLDVELHVTVFSYPKYTDLFNFQQTLGQIHGQDALSVENVTILENYFQTTATV